ncbi:ABC transporter permease subunit [Candidatus Nomurabacteria bacterium]|uniref:ABC transporter permease subunit n=1 Tax=Candidatus Dojkabacteria bacterium TaxID=2099670 RepID=A0A955KWV4_9BACT|nr:ABC transporter permease subunit [Candidatus Dojkabacteria bacterium]MCB9790048.1 ABC transporter permease subunit [Candidatus Nomurabacteria bacterium]
MIISGFFLLILLFTEWYVTNNDIPRTILPLPSDVFRYLYENLTLGSTFYGENLLEKSWVSMRDALAGFGISVILGSAIGVIFAKFEIIKESLHPPLFIIQLLPVPAFAPVVAALLGYGTETKILIIVLFTIFPVVIAVESAVRSIPKEYYALMKGFNSSRVKTMTSLVIPGIVPDLFVTMRILATASFVGSIVAELPLVVTSGIGKDLYNSFNNQIPLRVWSSLIVIACVALAFYFSVVFVGNFVDKKYRYGRFQ